LTFFAENLIALSFLGIDFFFVVLRGIHGDKRHLRWSNDKNFTKGGI
jgi:hypothetical protein